jgi:hypothetical protein
MFGTILNTRNLAQKARAAKALEQCKAGLTKTKSIARLYTRDDDGSLLIFGLFTFVIVLLLAGIGLDVVRHETLRTQLQSTTDRAVLAAANVEAGSTEEDAKVIVRDYFAKAGLTEYLDDVQVTGGGLNGGRKVRAVVKATIPTYFMKFSGIDTLELTGVGAAQQSIADLEIALVLDVSGSMSSNNRLKNLDTAGKQFAETVFGNSQPGRIAVSVVPYSTQVNVGPTILSQVNLNDAHPNTADGSHCLNFSDDDFYEADMELPNKSASGFPTNPGAKYYAQTADTDPWYNYSSTPYIKTCLTKNYARVLPYSTSLDSVKSKIGSLEAEGSTSIEIGVKWGAALLAPASTSFTQALIATGEIDDENAIRPKEFSAKTLKVMVVMSDGENTDQDVIRAPYRSGESDIYINDSNGDIWFPQTQTTCWYTNSNSGWGWGWGKKKEVCETTNQYYKTRTGQTSSSPYGRPMLWQEVWANFTVSRHADLREDLGGDSSYSWENRTLDTIDSSTKNTRLKNICNAAKKDDDILIFTIAFEASYSGKAALKSCASSDAHYYNANGIDITDTFAAVASKITELRLVE